MTREEIATVLIVGAAVIAFAVAVGYYWGRAAASKG
jgi:hypothetical protein